MPHIKVLMECWQTPDRGSSGQAWKQTFTKQEPNARHTPHPMQRSPWLALICHNFCFNTQSLTSATSEARGQSRKGFYVQESLRQIAIMVLNLRSPSGTYLRWMTPFPKLQIQPIPTKLGNQETPLFGLLPPK